MTPAARVESVLRRGRAHAQAVEQVARRSGLDVRTVQRAVAELRDAGVLVGSATEPPAGYYLCATRAEGLEVYRALRRRSIGQMARARKVLVQARALSERPEVTRVLERPEMGL